MLPAVSSSSAVLEADTISPPSLKRPRHKRPLEDQTPIHTLSSAAKRTAIAVSEWSDERRPFSSPSKAKSPVCGPSPGAIRSLAKMPTTEERHEARIGRILADAEEDADALEEMIDSLSSNPSVTKLVGDRVLYERIADCSKKVRKKCFTIAQIGIYTLEGKDLVLKAEELLDETFISSCKKHAGFVSLEVDKVRSATNRKKPTALFDFHSERASLHWLEENIDKVVGRLEEDFAKIGHGTVINCNLVTKASSCSHCIQVLGLEKYSRVADTLQTKIVKELKLDPSAAPHVTLIHQGLKHHHRKTARDKKLPQAEFYCSRSFVTILGKAKDTSPRLSSKKLF